MNQSQKEFEAWAKDQYLLDVSKSGGYMSVPTKNAWSAWQASRSALVVELPKPPEDAWGTMLYERWQIDGMNVMLEDCQGSLDKAGITYK